MGLLAAQTLLALFIAFRLLLYLPFGALVGSLASRKGYSFGIWMFSGIIGLAWLAFLPFANKAATSEERSQLVIKGDTVGCWISGVMSALTIFLFAPLCFAYRAHRKGRSQLLWAVVGILVYGAATVALSFLLPVVFSTNYVRADQGTEFRIFHSLFAMLAATATSDLFFGRKTINEQAA